MAIPVELRTFENEADFRDRFVMPLLHRLKHCDDPQRLLVRYVRDEVFVARDVESQRAFDQVRASVPDVRRCRKRGESQLNVGEYRSAAWTLSSAMYSQISSRSAKASWWKA